MAATRAGVVVLPAAAALAALAGLDPTYQFVEPLVEAGGAGIDVIWLCEPTARWPGRHLRLSTVPTIVVVGDDPGDGHGLEGFGGPDAWGCVAAAARWASAAIIHGAGGEAQHYAIAVRGAVQHRRMLLVETTSKHATAWDEMIACNRRLLILPTRGSHPIDDRVLH